MPQLKLSQIILNEKRRPEWAESKKEVKRKRKSIEKRWNSLYDIDDIKVMWIILYCTE